jgi:hypothetical protein
MDEQITLLFGIAPTERRIIQLMLLLVVKREDVYDGRIVSIYAPTHFFGLSLLNSIHLSFCCHVIWITSGGFGWDRYATATMKITPRRKEMAYFISVIPIR